MKHPWANMFVLLLATGSIVTGYYAFVAAEPEQAWQTSAHRAAGLAVVAVLMWKVPNVLRPLRRRYGAWTTQDWVAVGALSLLLTDIMLGVAWSHIGRFSYLGSSGMTWHALLVFLIVPMILWHLARYKKLLRPRYWAERRSVLRLGGLAIAGTLLWQIGARFDGITGIAQAKRFTGSYAAGDFTGNSFPTTSWLNDSLAIHRPGDVDAHNNRRGGYSADRGVRRAGVYGGGDGGAGLHRRMALDADMAGDAARNAAGASTPPDRGGEHHGDVGDGVLPAVRAPSRGGIAARDARRRASGCRTDMARRCGWWCRGSAASSG